VLIAYITGIRTQDAVPYKDIKMFYLLKLIFETESEHTAVVIKV